MHLLTPLCKLFHLQIIFGMTFDIIIITKLSFLYFDHSIKQVSYNYTKDCSTKIRLLIINTTADTSHASSSSYS